MNTKHLPKGRRHRAGAVLPLVAIMLPIVLLLAGVAINIAYLQLTATELKISTDAAAHAAGGTYTRTLDEALALAAALESGSRNKVAGAAQEFEMADLVVGGSTTDSINSRYVFTAGAGNNSVQVTGRRDAGSLNGRISTLFPNLMGVSDFGLTSQSISTRIEIDLVLVIDRSGSMAYGENEPAVYPPSPAAAVAGWDFGDPVPAASRWDAAREGVEDFLNEVSLSALDEQVSLVTYSTSAIVDEPLTNSFSFIRSDLNFYSNNFAGGGTNIKAAVAQAADALQGPNAREFAAKVIVIFTDGQITAGGDPVSSVESLAEDGVRVFAISFSDEADTALMGDIAAKGKGFHRHAETRQDLKDAFVEIVRRLPTILTK